MGKRSNFELKKHGQYYTPESAIAPLIKHLPTPLRYIEPCAGNGAIARYLAPYDIRCTAAFDIEPGLASGINIVKRDATLLMPADIPPYTTHAVTNPPWPKRGDQRVTLRIIRRMLELDLTAVMLLPASFMHVQYAGQLLRDHCTRIISVGRVKWVEGSPYTSLDDACWYIFRPEQNRRAPRFYPRR